ncbi:hypothetical protein B4U84_27205 [Westiellopsis prolifica IICB1]|nr:AmbU2 [Fischerella ambigua UTEX 1903]APB62245.1 Stig cyclase [Fischerella ambigua UTEX 1903]TBR57112.1 hypothetical protein B4U84_27205 [Westiellopsis prolifica IICB1]
MKLKSIVAVVFLIFICLGINTPANATGAVSIPIKNAGFEDPFLEVKDYYTVNTPPGWSTYDPNGLIPEQPTVQTSYVGVTNATPSSAFYDQKVPEGRNMGSVYLAHEPGSGIAGLEQTLDTVLESNKNYTLLVDIGNSADGYKDISLADFPGYRVELLAGDKVIAVDHNSVYIKEGEFKTSMIKFTAKPDSPYLGQKLGIRLINSLQTLSGNIDFDNVRLSVESAVI